MQFYSPWSYQNQDYSEIQFWTLKVGKNNTVKKAIKEDLLKAIVINK